MSVFILHALTVIAAVLLGLLGVMILWRDSIGVGSSWFDSYVGRVSLLAFAAVLVLLLAIDILT
jgi:uncharacterized membrane protein